VLAFLTTNSQQIGITVYTSAKTSVHINVVKLSILSLSRIGRT